MDSLKNILQIKINKLVATLSTIGTLLGLLIILITIDFFCDYQKIKIDSKDALGNDFIIITKKINELHTTGILSTSFKKNEIESIKSQPYFNEVIAFNKNLYEAYIESKSEGFPLKFSSLVTFEAIPNEYVDIEDSINWNWDSSSQYLPVIVPRSYMNMYNFGMADMQSLPVISENMISNFTVVLKVSGKGYSETYDTKIVGFSDRIESVLVPEAFMTFSNRKYSGIKFSKPKKLILTTKDINNQNISTYLKSKGYYTNKEKLKGAESSKILNLTISALIFLGFLVLFLSLIGFLQQTQIKISQSRETIYKLSLIGVPKKTINHFFIKKLNIQFILLCILALFISLIFRFTIFSHLIESIGLQHNIDLNLTSLFAIFGIIIGSFGYIFYTINTSLKKIFLNE